MKIDRRGVIVLAGSLAASPAPAATRRSASRSFPKGFLWGASTAGHQVEGNNVASDLWLLENLKPTVFAEPSGDAADSFNRWREDLDLCVAMGLNTYRFGVEWARIEPEHGLISRASLDHYKQMVDGCHKRGLKPIVTFNHFTTPRWFATDGGWLNPDAADRFAAYCETLTKAIGDGIDHALTFNEPNLPKLLQVLNLPKAMWDAQHAMLDRATAVTGSRRFVSTNVIRPEDIEPQERAMLAGHRRARAAIKAVRGNLPVGFSIAIFDDQGEPAVRDAMRQRLYGAWLEIARGDDFIGVQNYERAVWAKDGTRLPPPADSPRGHLGSEVYPASLAEAVRYAHRMTRVPVLVTEHGVGTSDDRVRQMLIPAALRQLRDAIADGVPVKGYCHWSLIDNFEWIFGYGPKFGLHSVDRTTFRRTAKPSARVYGAIARANAI